MPRNFLWPAWVLLIFVSPIFRWLEWQAAVTGKFGYLATATHLRLDGLVLGFGLSHVAIFAPMVFKRLVGCSLFVAPTCIIGLVALEWVGGLWRYVLWTMGVETSELRGRQGCHRPMGYDSDRLVLGLPRASARYPYRGSIVSVIGAQNWFLYWPLVAVLIVIATTILSCARS